MSYSKYHAWTRARIQLLERLSQCTSAIEVQLAVDDFFHRHLFEFGQAFTVSREMLTAANIDVPKMLEHKAAQRMADEIVKQGLIQVERHTSPVMGERFEFRCLVLGFPDLGVHLKER